MFPVPTSCIAKCTSPTPHAGITMFKNLPRQTFGKLQSKLFPLYFILSTGMTAVLLGTLCFAGGPPPRQALINLGEWLRY